MATTKSAKVQAEIEKAKAKLAEQQAIIKALETKHTELENLEIIDIVRGYNIPLDDLAAVLQSIKGGAAPTNTAIPEQTTPKQKQTKKENAKTIMEDTNE